MRTNFTVNHSIDIQKKSDSFEAILSFVVEESGKTMKIHFDPWQMRALIQECTRYLSDSESMTISKLKELRSAFNYSNSQPQITYINPNK